MAKMIPDVDPITIKNEGERYFYQSAAELPDDYTVLYSFKHRSPGEEQDIIREVDFVIVHPSLGCLVLEVKQGDILCQNHTWYEWNNGEYSPLNKDPVEQARTAMFNILGLCKKRYRQNYIQIPFKYGVAFPQCTKIVGFLPQDLDQGSVFLFEDMENLDKKMTTLFKGTQTPSQEVVRFLIHKVLAPSFQIFATLEEKIDMFHKRSRRLLTEEQERILEETELDHKKIFLGSAGTGKTFLAMEKARRLAREGKQVLLTCFNKNLAAYFRENITECNMVAQNFHDFIFQTVNREIDPALAPPRKKANDFYNDHLPTMAFDYFMSQPENKKFDVLIVDEGQDFQESWFDCLESMRKEEAEFYIFADPNQTIFNTNIEKIKKLPISMQKLTRNLRNTEEINKWMNSMMPEGAIKSLLPGGLPLGFFPWKTPAEEKSLIEKEVGRLVSQGIRPGRIIILSPNRKEKSSLADVGKIKDWPLGEYDDTRPNALRFCTIRSFKGLEADIVFLIGLKEDTRACSKADIYVGGSRARFLLYLFYHADIPEDWVMSAYLLS